jgi:hypothetical protein
LAKIAPIQDALYRLRNFDRKVSFFDPKPNEPTRAFFARPAVTLFAALE